MILVVATLPLCLTVLDAVKAIAQSSPSAYHEQDNQDGPDKSHIEHTNTFTPFSVTVQILNGDQKGSGIVIRDKSKTLWIATNRHVVRDSSDVCIKFPDGEIMTGSVVQSTDMEHDIAFISVRKDRQNGPYAEPATFIDTAAIDFVVATGYSAETDSYLETAGVTLPILQGKILKSGYSITYSNQIEKGMSGGGVFSETGQIIGINALHGDPIWRSDWHDFQGRRLNSTIGKKLDAVSVGIAIQMILLDLDRILTASPLALRSNFKCLMGKTISITSQSKAKL